MKVIETPAELFVENRERLKRRLPANALVVVNANDVMPSSADGTGGYWPNPDLYYLSGVTQEETILLLFPDASDEKRREILFVRETSELLTIWEGHKLTKEEASRRSGVKQVKWLSEFPAIFHQLMCEAEEVFLNTNEHARAVVEVESRDARFIRQCQAKYPLHRYHRLARVMHELRMVKSPLELEMIRRASAITSAGFARVARFVRPGVNEAEVEAEFAHEFIRSKGAFAYPPIIAAGKNNNVLHYVTNDQECKAGDLLLLDVAAGLGQYMSDLTRTIPVSGKFTRRQKQVYKAVLRVFREVSANIRPGVTTNELRKLTEGLTEKECVDLGLLKPAEIRKQDPENPAVRKYFMHGVAHPIGLDVHDVAVANRPLEAGWVVTCEPGIYIAEEGFGVRLENTLHVTASGVEDLMEGTAIEAEEVEELMGAEVKARRHGGTKARSGG